MQYIEGKKQMFQLLTFIDYNVITLLNKRIKSFSLQIIQISTKKKI